MGYRRYLRDGGTVPRSTLSMRRKRAQQKAARNILLQRNVSALSEPAVTGTEGTSFQQPSNDHNMEISVNEDCARSVNVEPLCNLNETEKQVSKSLQGDVSSSESEVQSVSAKNDFEESEALLCENVQCGAQPDSHENPSNIKKNLTSRLCECLDTTAGDIVYMCLAMGLRHNLTWVAIEDMLKMFSTIYDNPEIPQSKKSLFKILNSSDQDLTYHVFCSVCEIALGVRQGGKCSVKCYLCSECSDDWKEDQLKCKNCDIILGKVDNGKVFMNCQECKRSTNAQSPSNFFVSLSLEKQFQAALKDNAIADLVLSHRFSRKKSNPDALEDIYDGEEYQKHFKNGGILSFPQNFSYSFNTDGISTGKSTCKTMWPIYVNINELHYKLRAQNKFLSGLYVGKKDPNQLVFLQPFVNEANKLSTEGFKWQHHGNEVISKAIPLCAVLDSVARAPVLSMQTFHAFYGCTYCYQEQERTAPRKRRFEILAEPAALRTPESTYQDALIAYEKRDLPKPEDRVHRGVKGPSVNMGLLYFNLIWGFAIDYMHAVLLGIVKTHMKLIFEASRRKYWLDVTERTAIDDIYKSIDERLLSIKPPTGITRVPRSISMWKCWKASEWRSWLLFYCIPCLCGLIKDKYIVHISLLSRAVSLLLQSSVTLGEVDEAHNLLMEYCRLFHKYFDVQDTIYNLHLLTHLKQSVLCHGPLWTANAFCYEGQNRHILQLFTSPKNVLYQIVRRFNLYSSMPTLCDQFVSSYNALEFSENLLERRLSRVVQLTNGILIGKAHQVNATNEMDQLLFSKCNIHFKDCKAYKRMLFKGMRITSSEYSKGKENNDSYVMCASGSILCVKYILLLPNASTMLFGNKIIKSKRLIVDHWKVQVEHVRAVKREGDFMLVSPDEVTCQCIFLHISGDSQYVTYLPSGCNGD
ncbi:Integration host factor subunit beta [Frankliniella fusca]|uniref:Integration host factor subunit beta n=1 Tax=Frankliniella fusca TaxID=407009 RepID=A0AAE1I4Q8_9NEOP|nr:Integration host factor subunit beta [Frankliniella fusca]